MGRGDIQAVAALLVIIRTARPRVHSCCGRGRGQAYLTSPAGPKYAQVVLIAEELILVALDPVKGTVPLGARTYLNAGLAGALLAELAIAGEPRHQRRADRADPPPDPFLAEVLADRRVSGRDDAALRLTAGIPCLFASGRPTWRLRK